MYYQNEIMKNYKTPSEAVIDLQERGYCHDFQLKGNDLLWLQEKVLVRVGDFQIVEYHHFLSCKNKATTISVYGILAISQSAMGILIRHNTRYNAHASPIIRKKMCHVTQAVTTAINNLLN